MSVEGCSLGDISPLVFLAYCALRLVAGPMETAPFRQVESAYIEVDITGVRNPVTVTRE